MGEKKHYKFSIRMKLVVLTFLLAIITYSISALFLYTPYVSEIIDISEGTFTLATLLLGVVWSGVLAFIAAGWIIKPLKKLEKSALEVASGQLQNDFTVSKSDDEIRSLGLAFQEMLANLREIVKEVGGAAIETGSKVTAITEESRRASEQASSIARTINEISSGAENSATSVQTTVESVEDVVHIAEKVRSQAQSTKSVSENMVKDLSKSTEVLQSLLSGMGELSQENEQSLAVVRELENHAKKISQIIKLVGDIAEQTNLLALNASIEAARAGEHGKGFAVVAEEVRHLADESKKSVSDISKLIQSIQGEVKNVVNQITAQVHKAAEETQKGNQTQSAMEEMAKTIHEVAESVQGISDLVDQQMAHIQSTATQSQEVAAIAEETSAGAEEVAAATQEQAAVIQKVEEMAADLKAQAEKLQHAIEKYQV